MGLAARAVVGLAIASLVTLATAAVTGSKPPFDWTQFLKGVKRGAVSGPESNSEELDIDYQDSQIQVKPLATNPMAPFLSMKPFFPVKPTFMPPVVDPQFFIDKKTALLNGLFSSPGGDKLSGAGGPFGGMAMAPSYFAGKKTAFLSTLFSQLATTAPQTETKKNLTKPIEENVLQRRLIAPWLTTPSPIDPKIMTDKKTAFLEKLFSSISESPDVNAMGSVPAKPTIVPSDYWVPFAAKSKVGFQPTVKPTIVPPGFWFPYAPSKDTSSSLKPFAPAVDPSAFIDKKTKFLNDLMTSLKTPSATKPMDSIHPPGSSSSVSFVDENNQELSEFLDKLITALTLPTLMIKRDIMDEIPENRKRSSMTDTEDTQKPGTLPLTPKDKIMNTFMGELSGIKTNIVDTATQMMKIQKENAKTMPAALTKPGKKIGPPFGSPFASMWSPMAKLAPTPDPSIAFEQKINILNQVYDMLSNLQKDVESALNEMQTSSATPNTQVKNATNTTILDLLRKKLIEMDDDKVNTSPQMYGAPFKYNVRDVNNLHNLDNSSPQTRNIKMGFHQGYQNLPPGAMEFLQAGGGDLDHGKEGGGIKLQIVVPA